MKKNKNTKIGKEKYYIQYRNTHNSSYKIISFTSKSSAESFAELVNGKFMTIC